MILPRTAKDISQDIINSPATVLFIDTCIFLDILRDENINIGTIKSAIELIKMSQNNPSQIWLLTSSIVRQEWHDNIASVSEKLRKRINKCHKILEEYLEVAELVLNKKLNNQETALLNLHEHLKSLSNNFLDCCLQIEEESYHKNAMYRIRNNIAPASKGKSEPKDCIIFESFLDVANKIRQNGYQGDIYFASSNITDYGKIEQPKINNDLERVTAKLINHLSEVTQCKQ